MSPNPQRKLPLHATHPADRTLQGRHLVPWPSKARRPNASTMATAATVPTPTPATDQARKPGGTRSPAPLRPPAPLKASQLPIIRLAASLRD